MAVKKSAAKPTHRARIRMYRVGLGDCFLLTFFNGGKQQQILIDCGMFAGSRIDPNSKEKDLQLEIVNHIAETTGGHIDAVVVTHEHMDHVSIFNSAKTVFEEKLSFGEAWFGWLEDPRNKVASDLRQKYEGLKTSLAAALSGLQQLAASNPEDYETLHGGVAQIAEFTGLAADGSEVAEQPRAAMQFVKKQAKGSLRFGSPGDVWEVFGVKVYVLGPPPTEEQLRTMERAGASYDKALMLGLDGGASEMQQQFPFAAQWRRKVVVDKDGLSLGELQEQGALTDSLARYNDSQESWRRIDNQAFSSASSLALQMDKYINNTSLALAFEFPDGDVLLFPGDAQVGSWDSWFDIKKFDVPALLKRTIFYKVGHHGSHNATLKPALEQMNHPKLVAMIPTNQKFAKNSKHWTMPAPNLFEALEEHTAKRLLRNDQGVGDIPDPMKSVDWGGLEKNVTVDRLFIDYFV
ncbi:MAG: MBL fold metallo-hydrolase [Bryobacteraceae bacterium]